jgi:hypothetical protein
MFANRNFLTGPTKRQLSVLPSQIQMRVRAGFSSARHIVIILFSLVSDGAAEKKRNVTRDVRFSKGEPQWLGVVHSAVGGPARLRTAIPVELL